MTICFESSLVNVLENIQLISKHHFSVHDLEQIRDVFSSCAIVEKYGEQKWAIIELLNQTYDTNFNLYNWIEKNSSDEVSFFLNEAGSNSLNYSQFKAPYNFSLWLGKKGFIIGVEQKGTGFDVQKVIQEQIKENEGAGFNFFSNCQSKIFFDNFKNAKVVYLKHLFTQGI